MGLMEMPGVAGAYMSGANTNPYKDRVAWGQGQAATGLEYGKLMASEAANQNTPQGAALKNYYTDKANSYGAATENIGPDGRVVSTSAMNPMVNNRVVTNNAWNQFENNGLQRWEPKHEATNTFKNMYGGWAKPGTMQAWQDAAVGTYRTKKNDWDYYNNQAQYWATNPAATMDAYGRQLPAGWTAEDARAASLAGAQGTGYPAARAGVIADYENNGPGNGGLWRKLAGYHNAQNWKVGGSNYSPDVQPRPYENVGRPR